MRWRMDVGYDGCVPQSISGGANMTRLGYSSDDEGEERKKTEQRE